MHNKIHSLVNELRVLRHISHPNIVLFQGAVIDPQGCEVILVFEKVQGLQLNGCIGTPPAPPDYVARVDILLQICCALRYLHSRSPVVVHGDLKGSNILVEDVERQPRIKLLDFGLARLRTRQADPLGGTWMWMAPELLNHQEMRPRTSADVFSFGLLIGYIMAGLKPVRGATPEEASCAAAMPSMTFPKSCPCHAEVSGVAEACVLSEAEDRPPMHHVHAYISRWLQESTSGQHQLPKASREPAEGSATQNLVKQHYARTKRNAQRMAVIDLISHWNYALPESAAVGGCCNFHAGIAELLQVATHMLFGADRLPCKSPVLSYDWQCPHCGTLDCAECQICGQPGSLSYAPPLTGQSERASL